MKQIMTVVIEIESNCTHSIRNIEEALNFFWGSDGTFKVVEATRPTPCPECGKEFSHYTGCSLSVEIDTNRRGEQKK